MLYCNMIPFWSAGNVLTKSKTKLSTFEEVNRLKKIKSGDVLVNSLGILAFISAGAEGKSIDWDPLANWLYEQQLDDGTYDNALKFFIKLSKKLSKDIGSLAEGQNNSNIRTFSPYAYSHEIPLHYTLTIRQQSLPSQFTSFLTVFTRISLFVMRLVLANQTTVMNHLIWHR
uniref:Tetratricopeptide repeat protein n=1 Tax=Heterorhabditis bacteriophora TaxID=37862 RepID=A0A1I7W6U6_HETBA